jgi:hypothetical protein
MSLCEEALKAAPPIIQAVSVAITAFFAVKSLRAWRTQLVGKRRFEVAEQIVMATHRATEALREIRNPGSFSSEARDRKPVEGETEAEARSRETYYAVYARMRDRAAIFVELSTARLLCKIHFGAVASNHIDAIFRVRHSVRVAAIMLTQSVGGGDVNPELLAKWHSHLWATDDCDDELATKLNEAAEAIEAVCTPHLN